MMGSTFASNVISFILFLLLLLSLIKPEECSSESAISDIEVSVPSTHTTLSGDVPVKIQTLSLQPLLLQLFRLEGNTVQSLTNISVPSESRVPYTNITILKIPCGFFSREGKYYVLVKKRTDPLHDINEDDNNDEISINTQIIDVQWSMPKLNIEPDHIQTYPKNPVVANLHFPEVRCPPIEDALGSSIPEFWLELYYCGHSLSSCDTYNRKNQSYQVLYSEQVRGFPGSQNITLQCEYFGLAGHYALFLRTTSTNSWLSYKSVYLKVDWSEEFVFNVHAQSIFPCDSHNGGITILFQYPACILLTGDRVRVFARHRADVASLVPPTSLEYVAEQKVLRGSNKLKFDCDLFSEHYIEYCFVYVSQAITGAVADVRMDCVSTLPVSESKSGGWGPWSEWTPCSSTCIGGTRSRFRLCDSPLPRFGGKFCEGKSVETEKCGTEFGSIWECFDGNFDQFEQKLADTPSVKEEVGLYCRCGCVVHLGRSNPRRILATSSQSCPGRIFWQIQADSNCIIQFKIEWFDSTCGRQWLKIRDGMSLSSNLLADISDVLGKNREVIVNATGSTMLLEFFSDEYISNGQLCGGGFLAYARQLDRFNVSPLVVHRNADVQPFIILKLTAVHSTAIFFLSGVLIAMALLGAQYTFRYRKYQIAYTEDHDSVADPSVSCATLLSRRSSNSTLFSEVLSLRQLSQQVISEITDKTENIEHKNMKASVESCNFDSSEAVEKEDSVNNKICTDTQKEDIESQGDMTESPSSASTDNNKPLDVDEKLKSPQDDILPTPAKGLYSSSHKLISRATIRNTIPKETKDKKNRAKLLAGPSGSDFSISGADTDLEIDYYDYNVRNAGAAPGSYLGMDPAFLVYIPPLYDSGEISPSNDNGADGIEITNDENIFFTQNKDNLEKKNNVLEKGISLQNLTKIKSSDQMYNMETKYEIRTKSEEERILCMKENQPVIYGSKEARMQLHDLSENVDFRKGKMKIEEFPMIDSNILDEIKYADDDEEEKH